MQRGCGQCRDVRSIMGRWVIGYKKLSLGISVLSSSSRRTCELFITLETQVARYSKTAWFPALCFLTFWACLIKVHHGYVAIKVWPISDGSTTAGCSEYLIQFDWKQFMFPLKGEARSALPERVTHGNRTWSPCWSEVLLTIPSAPVLLSLEGGEKLQSLLWQKNTL